MLDKTFDPKKIEEKHYKDWESAGAFACDPASDKQPFTVMMPPPNVTGSLHIGHALNHTLQDILVRYQRMKGRDALWQPGMDHAGIATQMVVERELGKEGKSRRDMGRKDFLKRVWEWKEESGGTIVEQLRRLGTTPDWARERFTMDEGLSKAVIKVFVRLHKEGLIYRDKRLVNWDPKLQTAVSDLEVEQKDQKSKMWHIRYPVEGETAEHITVATTRPETMLGDTAVAVHPDDERYKDMIGKSVALPIAGRLIPIVADEHADPEQGSGAVKITPAHDFNDFEVGKRNDLPMINIFDTQAKLNENVPKEYQGLTREEARKKILAELEDMDLLEEVETIKNAVPYSQRSAVVIEPYLTDQWYVDTPTLAKPALEAVRSGKTNFYPKQYENMYFDWLENQLPWCISRQLWWGHQIPVWYDEDQNVYVAESEEEAQVEAGADKKLTRDEDVLDTWFSSALWPFSTLGWPEDVPEVGRYYPGDVLVTGFDIITFWVSRMMMMSLHLMDEVPFKDVYIHALVRDASGQKMSKSKGNVMDPLELIDEYGADALRFTMCAMAAQGRDIKLSEDRLKGYRNFATKLWNAARYCEMNECKAAEGFDPGAVEGTLNKWIISSLRDCNATIEEALGNYQFNLAAAAIYQFVWGTFCDWYLEFTKPVISSGVILSDSEESPDSQGGPSTSRANARSAQDDSLADETRATTGWVLEQIFVLLNPFMPFITEELAAKPKVEKLIVSAWPEYGPELEQANAAVKIEWLIRFISEIRSVRADMNVPAAAKIKLLVKDACAHTQEGLKAYDAIIKQMARLESIEMLDGDVPKGSIQTLVDQTMLILPIADIIDLDKERARLSKEIDKLMDDIKKTEQKLGNKQFIDNAPDEVVDEHKNRKQEAEKTLGKLSQALKQLEAA
ncbi:MAG: valine--tRNA ligase [Micavibrio sp.]|nr:MAG: valine--tRNA ligase [Micavibrio sp.]